MSLQPEILETIHQMSNTLDRVITRMIKCQQCSNMFDEPRLLPCGSAVCNHCVFIIGENLNENNEFKCLICEKIHVKSNDGFPIIHLIAHILKGYLLNDPIENERQLDLESLKSNLKWIKEKSNQIGLMRKKTGPEHINDHCAELRRLVQLSTEEKILRLNDLNEKIISQINAYESETKQKYNNEKKNYFQLETMLLNSELIMKEAEAYLNGFRIHDEHVKKSIIETANFMSQLQDELDIFDRDLFSKNKMNFKVNGAIFDDNILGKIDFFTDYYDEYLSDESSLTDSSKNSSESEYTTSSESDNENSFDQHDNLIQVKHQLLFGDDFPHPVDNITDPDYVQDIYL